MTRPVRLAMLAASPVYYRAPLYRLIAADPRVELTAIFASREGVEAFGLDPLSGYRSTFLRRADRTRADGSFLALRAPDVVRVLARGDFDVLWTHGYYSLTHALASTWQRLRRRPLLVREVQTLLHERPPLKEAIRGASLRALLRGSYGLYVGSHSRAWFRHYGVRDDRLFFVPNAVDNARLRAESDRLAPRKAELRRELGIRDDSGPVILSVGRLVAKKQPEHLLEAFRRVRAARTCTLLVVGGGPLEPRLRETAARERIPDVVFAGFLDQREIVRAYAAADIFALVSREHETWGLVVNEALNFALPVVVSDKVGCAPDLVRPENGFIVPADDPALLAHRLGELVDSAGLRERLGAVSRDVVDGWRHEVGAVGVLGAIDAAVGIPPLGATSRA